MLHLAISFHHLTTNEQLKQSPTIEESGNFNCRKLNPQRQPCHQHPASTANVLWSRNHILYLELLFLVKHVFSLPVCGFIILRSTMVTCWLNFLKSQLNSHKASHARCILQLMLKECRLPNTTSSAPEQSTGPTQSQQPHCGVMLTLQTCYYLAERCGNANTCEITLILGLPYCFAMLTDNWILGT